jgi:hypothetical protein
MCDVTLFKVVYSPVSSVGLGRLFNSLQVECPEGCSADVQRGNLRDHADSCPSPAAKRRRLRESVSDAPSWVSATAINASDMCLDSAAFLPSTNTLVGVVAHESRLHSWKVDDGRLTSQRQVQWPMKLTSVASGGAGLIVIGYTGFRMHVKHIQWADPATLLPTDRLDTSRLPQGKYWTIACRGECAVVATTDRLHIYNGAQHVREVRPDQIVTSMLLLHGLLLLGDGDNNTMSAYRWDPTGDVIGPRLWTLPALHGICAMFPSGRHIVTQLRGSSDLLVHEVEAGGQNPRLASRVKVTGARRIYSPCALNQSTLVAPGYADEGNRATFILKLSYVIVDGYATSAAT